LKGRNQLKHRTNRYKPHIDHHPLNPRHYSPNDPRLSEGGMSSHRDAVSPPYRPLEKVFHPGPRGVPLFQSPSLPNINLKSSRSQVHFPSSASVSIVCLFVRFPSIGIRHYPVGIALKAVCIFDNMALYFAELTKNELSQTVLPTRTG